MSFYALIYVLHRPYLSVESSGPPHRWVQAVWPVGRPDDEEAIGSAHPIH